MKKKVRKNLFTTKVIRRLKHREREMKDGHYTTVRTLRELKQKLKPSKKRRGA